jgi:hypothetical protein
VYINADARSKLDAKSRKCYFIGYGDEAFGYKFWDDQNQKIREVKMLLLTSRICTRIGQL